MKNISRVCVLFVVFILFQSCADDPGPVQIWTDVGDPLSISVWAGNNQTIGVGEYVGYNYSGVFPIIRAYNMDGHPWDGVDIYLGYKYPDDSDDIQIVTGHFITYSQSFGDHPLKLKGYNYAIIKHIDGGRTGEFEITISAEKGDTTLGGDSIITFTVINDTEHTSLSPYTHEIESKYNQYEVPGDGFDDFNNDPNPSEKDLYIEIDYCGRFLPYLDSIQNVITRIMQTADINVHFFVSDLIAVDSKRDYYVYEFEQDLCDLRNYRDAIHMWLLDCDVVDDYDPAKLYAGLTIKKYVGLSGLNAAWKNSDIECDPYMRFDSLAILVQGYRIIRNIGSINNWPNWIDSAHAIAAISCNEIGHALGLWDLDAPYDSCHGVMEDPKLLEPGEYYSNHNYFAGPELNHKYRVFPERSCAVNLRYVLGIHTVNPEY